MKIKPKDFRVAEGEKVDLDKRKTDIKPLYESEEEYEKTLAKDTATIDELQRLQYACDQYALLVIFQSMDAAGKDGVIRHVMSGVNPAAFQVFSFKQPSAEELDHDFLWRTTCRLPERGRIGIFNRSYYEEVLVVKVHPEILKAQGLPKDLVDEETVWEGRYRSIVELEAHLHRNGTRIIKFYLHVSKEEQRKRLLARIEEPGKNWKFSPADIAERKLWKQYMKAYEQCLSRTSTREAPWYVVPADDKKNARLIVASVMVEAMKSIDVEYPKADKERRAELEAIRKALSRPSDSH